MRHKLLAVVVLFFTTIILALNPVIAQSQKDASNEQAIKMLSKFYKKYMALVADGMNRDEIIRTKANNCTKSLLKKVDSQLKSGVLDFDPFINAQDADVDDLKTLSIVKDKKEENVFIVSYIDKYTKKKIVVKLTLVKINGIYKINDFVDL